MGESSDGDQIFDRDYLRQLLTEVRPDTTLDDFRFYTVVGEFTEARFAELLAELLNAGEAAIYPDEFNAPIVCLTALGASRAGVHLSNSHPPIWLRDDGEEPPIYAVRDDGFILFTDLEADMLRDHDERAFAETRADPRQSEPVEVLANVEAFSEWLLLDRRLPGGELIPKRDEFCFHGAGRAWPRGRDSTAPATRETPSASTWQEQFARCPFCRVLAPGEACRVCRDRGPARKCPDCDGVRFGFSSLCLWCLRSGIDHLLPPAEVVRARRRPARKPGRSKRQPVRK